LGNENSREGLRRDIFIVLVGKGDCGKIWNGRKLREEDF
jgi:hypothetical protein